MTDIDAFSTGHELTLSLLESVAQELSDADRAELLTVGRVIEDLLNLGLEPAEDQISGWVRDAHFD